MNNAFSLRFLFIIVTAAAALATTFTGLRSEDLRFVGLFWVLLSAVVCGICGGLLGLIVGLHELQRVRGALRGLITGGLTGVCMSPVVFTNLDVAPRVMAAQLIGAVMLVALGMSARMEQK